MNSHTDSIAFQAVNRLLYLSLECEVSKDILQLEEVQDYMMQCFRSDDSKNMPFAVAGLTIAIIDNLFLIRTKKDEWIGAILTIVRNKEILLRSELYASLAIVFAKLDPMNPEFRRFAENSCQTIGRDNEAFKNIIKLYLEQPGSLTSIIS